MTGLIVLRWDLPDSIYTGFHSGDDSDVPIHVKIDANPITEKQPAVIDNVRVRAESDWLSLDRCDVSDTAIDLHLQIHGTRLSERGALSNPLEVEIEYKDGDVERHPAILYVHL